MLHRRRVYIDMLRSLLPHTKFIPDGGGTLVPMNTPSALGGMVTSVN